MSREICHACGQALPKTQKQTCGTCGATWADGIDGCPCCGDGNPFMGIQCLTPLAPLAFAHIDDRSDRCEENGDV